ncbi:MAG: translocation/assembly module TamB domain-containing protein [Desulfobulbaceae bacterium]
MKKMAICILILVPVLGAAGLGFVLFTEQGLGMCVQAAGRALPGRLSATSVRGRLADRIVLENLRYTDASIAVRADALTLAWHPVALLRGTIVVRSLAATGVVIELTETESTPDEADDDAGAAGFFSLPLSLRVDSLAIETISLLLPGESRPMLINSLSLENAAADADLIRFEQGVIDAPAYRIGAGGRIANGREAEAEFSVSYAFHPEGYQSMEGTGEIAGSTAELHCILHMQKPFAATLKGVVYDPAAEANWQAELQSDRAELAAVSPSWPAFTLSGLRAYGSGTFGEYSLQVQSEVDYAGIRAVRVQTALDGDAGGLHLTDLSLSKGSGSLAGTGRLDWREDFSWEAELRGTDVALAEIHPAWPAVAVPRITASGSGIRETYQVRAEGEAAYEGVPEVHVIASMEGDGESLRFTDVAVSRMDAVLTGRGSLGWREDFSWQAVLEGRDIDPAVFLPQWPGALAFQGRSSGTVRNGLLRAEVDLDSMEGEVRDHPLRAGGAVRIEGKDYLVDDFLLEAAGSTLKASGRYGGTMDFRLDFDSTDLAPLWPEASGRLQARAEIGGTRHHPVFALELSGAQLSLGGVSVAGLAGEGTGDLSPAGEMRGSIRAERVNMAGKELETVRLELEGVTEQHRLRVAVRGEGAEALLEMEGGYRENGWEGRIDRGDIASGLLGAWRLAEPAALRLAGEEFSLTRLCMIGAEPAPICFSGEHGPDGLWSARADIGALPLPLLLGWREELRDIQGVLTGTVAVQGEGGVVVRGSLALTGTDVSLPLALPGESRHLLQWRDNSLQATYAEETLTATVDSTLADGSDVHMAAVLTGLQSGFPLDGAQADGFLEFRLKDLKPLAALTYPNLEPSGSLEGRLSFTGPAAEPLLWGSVNLVEGKMTAPPLGIAVEGLTMSLEARGRTMAMLLTGYSGGGRVDAETTFSWPVDAERPFTVAVKGERFELIRSPELQVRVSPDLTLTFGRRQAEIKGTVAVPEALIAPTNLAGTVSPSGDVVLVDDRPDQPREEWSLYADVTVVAGDDVQVNAFGLRGKVEGRLRVTDLPAKPVTGEGTLQVREGTFAFYGRGVRIETGRLLFSGGPIDNPGIEVRAENTSGGVTTGIQVSGFLRESELSFYSSPAMEEDAIITRLLMNTSLIGASGEQDGGLLGGVTADTGLDRISATVQEIRESLGVEDIRIETGRASEDLSLVIGTWLTPSLYISYGKNLLRESGSFNTRYQLGRGFFLETETGSTQSGADFKYEIER